MSFGTLYVVATPLGNLEDITFRAVRILKEAQVIAGPSALVAALVVSGLPTDHFTFEGFLPNRAVRRRKALAALSREARTMIFYESPHRLGAFLVDAVEEFGDP